MLLYMFHTLYIFPFLLLYCLLLLFLASLRTLVLLSPNQNKVLSIYLKTKRKYHRVPVQHLTARRATACYISPVAKWQKNGSV